MSPASLDTLKKDLVVALDKIDRPGSYCTSGSSNFVLPGLTVEGVGTIGLPLNDLQAERIKERCEQAGYGQGEQTIVDTNVRRVWRLKPDQFELANVAWQRVIRSIVDEVQTAFGLKEQTLDAHLYDLLLYEPGSFFLPHRDGEKLERMVATLVVVLPCLHSGGELIVRHEGQEQAIDFSGPQGAFDLSYAAFYADCEHEVRPLLAGHRLCLVYNLTLSKPKRSSQALHAPSGEKHIDRIASLLSGFKSFAGDESPRKLAVTLGHQYTQGGLAWDALKGVDRARAEVFLAAAKQAGFKAYLALVTLWESGSTNDGGDDYYSSRRPKYGYRETEKSDAGTRTMEEVFDWTLSVDEWCSPDGAQLRFGEMPLSMAEIVPAESLRSISPEEEFEGYTGNAGMTLEHWYRHAAIVLWPEEHNVAVLCSVGSTQAVGGLKHMLETMNQQAGKVELSQRECCMQFAKQIIAQWPEKFHTSKKFSLASETHDGAEFLSVLKQLGDQELIRSYLRNAVARDVNLDPYPVVAELLAQAGWSAIGTDLQPTFSVIEGNLLERNVHFMEQLCSRTAEKKEETSRTDSPAVLSELADLLVDGLVRFDTRPYEMEWQRPRLDRQGVFSGLLRGLLQANLEGPQARLIGHAQAQLKLYPLAELQIEAALALVPWLDQHPELRPPPLLDWLASCRQHLESLTVSKPTPPLDFRRIPAAKFGCGCKECSALNLFLASPTESELSFAMIQQRRNHLEQHIKDAKCDLDCTTNTRPRPQVLICRKTPRRLSGI